MNLKLKVDKTSPIPIYHQIATSLKNRIMNNEWQINDKMPSELNLAKEYSVSRVTLRQALGELEKEGIIYKIQGKGVFLQSNPKPIIHDFSLPSTLCSKLGKRGQSFDAQVLELILCPPISFINEILHLKEDMDLIFIKRLFLLEDRPIGINRSWLSHKVVPNILSQGLIDNHLSITLSDRYNLNPIRIENTIESARISSTDIKLLNVSYDTPVTIVSSISFMENNIPLEYSTTTWHGDKVKFHFNMD